MSSFQFHVHQKQTIIIWSGYITVNLYRISIFPFPRPVLHWTNTVLLWWLSCGASGWLFWILHCMKRMGFRKSEAWLHSYNLYKNCRRRTCFSLLTFKTEITRMTFISHGDRERQFAGWAHRFQSLVIWIGIPMLPFKSYGTWASSLPFIGIQLIYNVVLVCRVQQSESVMCLVAQSCPTLCDPTDWL